MCVCEVGVWVCVEGVCGRVGVWVYVSEGVWVCGCVDVWAWVCGYGEDTCVGDHCGRV